MENKTLSEEEASLWSEEITGDHDDLLDSLLASAKQDIDNLFGEEKPSLTDEQIDALFQSLINADTTQLSETTIEELANL